jgi:hypothetical protein
MLPLLCAVFVVGIILLISKLRRPSVALQKCVHIVVLGDLGRSPRMCNHAIEFEKHKFNVKLIGYAGWSFVISNQKKLPAKKGIY